MITENQLQRINSGATIVWENENTVLSAEIDKNEKGFFRLWFNGVFLAVSKRINVVENKLSDVVKKHDLTLIN